MPITDICGFRFQTSFQRPNSSPIKQLFLYVNKKETTQEITIIHISLLSENYSFQTVTKAHLKKNSMYAESSFCFWFWNFHNEKPKIHIHFYRT